MFARVLGWSALALALLCAGTAGAAATELAFDLKVEHGRVADNMRLIRVTQGEIVKLRWTTDQPLVVHLHGYDIEQQIAPGSVAELAFTAFATGRFPIHIHPTGGRPAAGADEDEPLVIVEVYPR